MNEEQFWIKIENLKQYIIQIKKMHPSDPKYISYWKEQKKILIEGLWGTESKGYRFCPGVIYGYGNFYTIMDTDHRDKTRRPIRPKIRDLEWHRGYNFIVAQGLSGFSEDDEYSCDRSLMDLDLLAMIANNEKYKERYSALFRKNGELKKYVEALEYVSKLHPKKLGVALFFNEAKNIIEFGTRSGGKSYWASWIALYFILTDGRKFYSVNDSPSASVCIGSGNSDKSSDLCKKIEEGMNALAIDKDLGVFGSEEEYDYEPNPFFKNMIGTLSVNNKKNSWRHEYKVISKGSDFTKGTKSAIFHVSYASNKKAAAESAAGGRYNVSFIEEVGLTDLVIDIHKSNQATLSTEGQKFGTEIYFGTSGNMETVAGARTIFENPSDFNCLEFEDVFEGTSRKIGFFIPSYMVDMRFKDEDGNTNIAAAKEFYYKQLSKIETAEAAEAFKMNTPLVPSHMWITKTVSILPKEEAKMVKKKLLENFAKKRTFVDIYFDSTKPNGVGYNIVPEKDAVKIDTFRETQGSNEKKNRNSKSTATHTIIYEFPEVNGPDDLYSFIGLDPYVADEQTEGESLGSLFILKNPKYISSKGITGDIIVAEITGKFSSRRDFYERIEKLLMLFGSPKRSLMYEANRGEDLEAYFTKRNKEYLLALTPYKYSDNKVVHKVKLSYGYKVGNQIDKTYNLNLVRDWLLTVTDIEGEKKMNIERICSLGLLDEIIEYDFQLDLAKKANYDRINGFIGCLIARNESYNEMINYEEVKEGSLKNFGKNPALKKLNSKLLNV